MVTLSVTIKYTVLSQVVYGNVISHKYTVLSQVVYGNVISHN
jgi:hypothetical protein